MYSTCIHCHASLGANAVIEAFPVGRRLAFDGTRGRLWAVCARCGRWNLSPLEERWEAIEQCERRFRETRLRVSTGHVGLARLREGLELVRIGEPLRPEFAAWRYGRQYARRRWRAAAAVGTGAAATVGLMATAVATAAAGAVIVPALLVGTAAASLPAIVSSRRDRALVRLGRRGTGNLDVRRADLENARLAVAERGADGGEGWRLLVGHRFGAVALEGREALRALRVLLPLLNGRGAGDDTVQGAVERVTSFDGRADLFAFAARIAERESSTWRAGLLERFAHESTDGLGLEELLEPGVPSNPGALRAMPPELRLALEMALHEESERRALDGELEALAAAWREAEEVAAIADALLLPESVDDWLRRRGARGET